ncbi:hypothetical protein VNI00_018675 [Paramarasmius palmivorus]|uniref:Uncharacterized protein n=1 Tax=Paramarasmius palmivorus TaxID=297713 RepID=A0AAW0AV81_9AGAR
MVTDSCSNDVAAQSPEDSTEVDATSDGRSTASNTETATPEEPIIPAPPILAEQMGTFIGKRVRLVGRILSVNAVAHDALMKSCDGSQVKITFQDEFEPSFAFGEVVGTVIDAASIAMDYFAPAGLWLDMKTVEQTIRIIHDARFREVFFPDVSNVVTRDRTVFLYPKRKEEPEL